MKVFISIQKQLKIHEMNCLGNLRPTGTERLGCKPPSALKFCFKGFTVGQWWDSEHATLEGRSLACWESGRHRWDSGCRSWPPPSACPKAGHNPYFPWPYHVFPHVFHSSSSLIQKQNGFTCLGIFVSLWRIPCHGRLVCLRRFVCFSLINLTFVKSN